MKKYLLLVLLLAGCTHGAFRLENDIFPYGVRNDDKYYTNGFKATGFDEEDAYSLSQNIYTPSKKKAEATEKDLKDNRPYSGWLNFEYRDYETKGKLIDVDGYQVGCTGRCSLAKETQTFVHNAMDIDVPTWDKDYSLKSEPGFIYSKELYYGILDSDLSYSSVFTRLRLGTLIDSISSGINFKYGTGIDRINTEVVTFKAEIPKEEFSYYVFGELEGRYVPYNYFLEGSMFQDERHTVSPNRAVFQADAGLAIKYLNYKVSYNYSLITDEWQGQNGAFVFGGLSFQW